MAIQNASNAAQGRSLQHGANKAAQQRQMQASVKSSNDHAEYAQCASAAPPPPSLPGLAEMIQFRREYTAAQLNRLNSLCDRLLGTDFSAPAGEGLSGTVRQLLQDTGYTLDLISERIDLLYAELFG